MKRVKVFGVISEFEEFLNKQDISVIDIKVQTVEQSPMFQEYFFGVVFYEDAPQNTIELAATTPNTPSAKPCAWCRGHKANTGRFANYCPMCGFDLRTASHVG